MKKKPKKKRGRGKGRNRKLLILMAAILIFLTAIMGTCIHMGARSQRESTGEVRAVWLAYVDFEPLGLKTDKESVFRNKVSDFLDKAGSNGINTIYFHVRAFDDAAWKSSTFKAMSSLTSKGTSSQKAKDVYSFDPLAVITQMTHSRGMELHAWMNPYRISSSYYWDPAYSSTTERIRTAVKEVMAYHVDGIHFDDYFYHASKGYKNRDNTSIRKASDVPSAKNKRKYVNSMVRSVYGLVKSLDSSAQLGISPQGNIDNCRSAGADVDTWLSSSGYVDYIVPQIYWTDQWGSSGKIKMFTSRLNAWKQLNSSSVPMYVGLAAYRTGIRYSDDPGWNKKSTNLADQLNILRSKGYKGYVLFSAKDFYREGAKKELSNYRKMMKRIPRVSSAYYDYRTIQIKWNQIWGVSGYEIWRASRKNGTYTKVGTTDKTNVSGYKVYRSVKKKGTYRKIKTTGANTLTYTNKSLKRGKRYYYKIRAYKTVNGKPVYSRWSSCSSKIAK